MANTLKVKRSAVAGKIPAVSDIDLGELAINTRDGKLFLKKDDGAESVVEIGSTGFPLTGAAWIKADRMTPAWNTTGAAVTTNQEIVVGIGGALHTIAAGTVVSLPTLAAGTDYTIYAAADGSLQAVDADSAAPSGQRVVGGFHVYLTGEITERSLWDLAWRPSAPNARGKTLSLDGQTWSEIYLVDVDYALHGYSRPNVTIADGSSPPKIPALYGGDGGATYSSGSWWTFNDVLASVGMRFPFYQEFTALAYGVVERQSVGTDPATTQHQAGHRSACGVEQATGVLWQWGADITGTTATGATAWNGWADGRGDIYSHSIRSPRFGAHWNDGSYAGSRASSWDSQPDVSYSSLGARGVCDHLNL